MITKLKYLIVVATTLLVVACSGTEVDQNTVTINKIISPESPLTLQYKPVGNLTKRLVFDLETQANYAAVSLEQGDNLLIDNMNIPTSGRQQISAIVKFNPDNQKQLSLFSRNADVTLHQITIESIETLIIPQYHDISSNVGIDKAASIKYGGPSIADIDNDGDYDFIVNNHNAESSKLYWNRDGKTVKKHHKNLARWFMHDLHGTALGDYDNDGDLDLVLTQGGGNGKNPSTANFYENVEGEFVLKTGDVGITKGGRGRGAKWTDADLDGDLDLLLFNESSLTKSKPQHFFYENKGDSTFEFKNVDDIQDVTASRVLVTDLNSDGKDDFIFYGPLSVWLGQGDFTYKNITSRFSGDVINRSRATMAITDIDIDNDGDLDLYLANGKAFEHGKGESPSFDFDPITKEVSIKPRGYKGENTFSFVAKGTVHFNNYIFLTQGSFRGKDYPIFLGAEKDVRIIGNKEEFTFNKQEALGWPEDTSANGLYIGHLGNDQWKAKLVRTDNIFWTYRFTLSGVEDAKPIDFEPENRNIDDILLRNDGQTFTDVSEAWGVPKGGNALGVTTGDFNNDGYSDLFVYRWGLIGKRISDLMLLNNQSQGLYATTMHGANDVGGPGNGDMGQAFDFDNDGRLDFLNGSEDGEWYLYQNQSKLPLNYALVRVGYAPETGIDAISAVVTLETSSDTYKRRVGSAGAVFSQSLLNTVHFGLGEQQDIRKITVVWRNGEKAEFTNVTANTTFDTDKMPPRSIAINSPSATIREGASLALLSDITPKNADRSVVWTSSNPAVISIDKSGQVKAVGESGKKATITATTVLGNKRDSIELTIGEWYPIPATQVSLSTQSKAIVEGDSGKIELNFIPVIADIPNIQWSSSNPDVMRVDDHGGYTAISEGNTTITASTVNNPSINAKITFSVEKFVAPFIKITNAESLIEGVKTNDQFTIEVAYHAGNNKKVIASDQGGVKYWFRHFENNWRPVKDAVSSDANALYTESGHSSATFSTEGYIPSAELPGIQSYQIRVSFTDNEGKQYNDIIQPFVIKAK